ncbi:maleylpyruvate isomerase N-terminal domain-containing protein [Hymenobacter antarcticus]|uniref:Mycothiol-dependent maleylpyruvate isomerase metal-binding domain-containing protein n=1 Tax=Hymenobacter antarcticus TaxID=486270 RepID=A0ABP7PRU0_9BACT
MAQAIPIETLPLFAELDRLLLELLRSPTPADWQRPTLARQWTMKDMASHRQSHPAPRRCLEITVVQ